MDRAVLGVATNEGVMVLRPGPEATAYTIAARGLLDRRCRCMTVAKDGRLMAGTDDFFVQHSSDGFEWKTSLEGLNWRTITALSRHPKHPDLLFAGTSSPAVYVSGDIGKTWRPLAPLDTLPNVIRWTALEAPHRASISSIACHPSHDGVLFASIEIGGLAASKDGGKSWTQRDEGLPPGIRQVLAPEAPGRLYVGTTAGVFRSNDLGGTWEAKNSGLPYHNVQAIVSAPGHPDIVLVSVSHTEKGPSAICQSQDGGESWETVLEGLPRLDDRLVTTFCFGQGGIYAGTDRGDIFGLDNLEGRWVRLGADYPSINTIVSLT